MNELRKMTRLRHVWLMMPIRTRKGGCWQATILFVVTVAKIKIAKTKIKEMVSNIFCVHPKKIGEDETILTFKGVGSTTNYSHGTDRYSFHLSHLGVSGALLIGWMRVLVIPLERFPESDFGFATLSKASMGRTVYLPYMNGWFLLVFM